MNQPIVSIYHMDEIQLCRLIATATQWLVYMGPGVSLAVAKAIDERWYALGTRQVKIILDVDSEVVRLGYGELAALELLQKTAQKLGAEINREPGVRIGLVIVDQTTFVFAPTPLLIEAGTTRNSQPNSITLDYAPESLVRELGLGEKGSDEQKIGRATVLPDAVEKVSNDLQANPPLKFDVARRMRVFNAHFEFVDFELKGTQLSRRKVPIPADLMGLAQQQKVQGLLHTNFQLIGAESPLSDGAVKRLKDYIVKRFLILLPKYGYVVLRSNKEKFLKAVKILDKYARRYQKRAEESLQHELDTNRAELMRALLPAIQRHPPLRWKRYLGTTQDDQALAELLDGELQNIFGTAHHLLDKIDIRVVVKGVTFESLNDEEFSKLAYERIPTLKTLHQEWAAAPEAK